MNTNELPPQTDHRVDVVGTLFLCLLFLSALWMVGCGSGGSQPDGDLRTDACDVLGLKIFNGTSCGSLASPVVAVLLTNKDLSEGSCSGTIISPTIVVTAAHCYCDLPSQDCSAQNVLASRVVIGGTQEIAVRDVKLHPDYKVIPDSRDRDGKLLNDIALLTLEQPTQTRALPIVTSQPVVAGDTLSVFGYGIDEDGVSGVPTFNTPPTTGYRIQSGEIRIAAIRDGLLESHYNGNGSNPCRGDSGGPVIATKNGRVGLVGLTSIGISSPSRACQPGEISIYTDLQDSSVLAFLKGAGLTFQ